MNMCAPYALVTTSPSGKAVLRTRFGRAGLYDVTVRRGGGDVIAEFRGRSHQLGPVS